MHSSKLAGDSVTLGLRTTIIACGIIGISFLSHAIYKHQNHSYQPAAASFIDCLSLAAISTSLIWTIISLILNFCKGSYHPVVDVSMELFVWCFNLGVAWCPLLLIVFVIVNDFYDAAYCDPTTGEACSGSQAKLLLASEIIVAIMIMVCGVLHFTLFVRACWQTYLRRNLNREASLGTNSPQELVEQHNMAIKKSKGDMPPKYTKDEFA